MGNIFGRSGGIDLGLGPKRVSSGHKPVSRTLRNDVWYKYMGDKTNGKCYCCRMRVIRWDDFQAGHVRAKAKGGNNQLSNLRPICGPCNRGMGTKTIKWHQRMHFGGKRTRTPTKPSGRRRPRTGSNGGLFGISDLSMPKDWP